MNATILAPTPPRRNRFGISGAAVFFRAGRTILKFARGRPHGRTATFELANAVAVLRYLVGRKMGLADFPTLQLGFGEQRHAWPLTRREDLTVLEEVFLDEDYAMDISAPDVVVDLGANFGAASIYFTLRWPQARVIAVEPNPQMYARLQSTTAGYPNISCFSCAVGALDGTMPFTISASSVGSGFFRHEHGAETIDVAVRTLSSLMTDCGVDHVDLLKFDVEGAEALLFEDSSVLDRVGSFVGEVHPDLMSEPVEKFLTNFAAFKTQREPLPQGRFLLRGLRCPP